MQTITTANDIRTWISNTNPGNVLVDAALVAPLAEAIRNADGRPEWGTDWEEWLDTHAEPIVSALAADATSDVTALRAECSRVSEEYRASVDRDPTVVPASWALLDALRDMIHALDPHPEEIPTTGETPSMRAAIIREARAKLALARVRGRS